MSIKPIETTGQCTNAWLGQTRTWVRRGFWTERGAQRWVSRQFAWSRTPPSVFRERRAVWSHRVDALLIVGGSVAFAAIVVLAEVFQSQ